MIKHIFKLIWNKKGANALVMIEILLAFLILFAVISFVYYNMDRFQNPLGFETDNRKYISYGDLQEYDSLQRIETWDLLKRSLEDLELVEEVSLGHDVGPYQGSNWCSGGDENGINISACYSIVDLDFISTNGMNIVDGRAFTEDDMTAAYPPVITNKYFMDEYFPDQSMIDSVIYFSGTERKIVGVVDAFKYNGEFSENAEAMILLHRPSDNGGDIRLTKAYLKMDPAADIAYEAKISQVVEGVLKSSNFVIQDASLLRKRSNLDSWIPIVALLSICGFLCLNIALGLFGVLSYAISKRKSEVGLRRALGAHAGAITQQFTLEILVIAGLAVLVGVIFAIQIPLLQVMDIDSSIFYRGIATSAAIILGVVTLCALYPSFQASRIHPATALHED